MSRPSCQKLIHRAVVASLALSACGASHAQRALDEVIVTAQKKDDTLQTVPMTVNAVTAETISKYNLLDFKDIQTVTPGLTIKEQDTRTSTIAMRGVNVLTDTGYGPGVAIYWNELNYDIDSAFKAMYDVGQIEILRGPQGTLRGITAPAGAVTIVTKQPSFNEIEGTIEQTFGERDLSNTQFGVSLPIIENKLALRIAGLYDHNKNDGIENITNGKENSSLTRSGRITLGLRATDNLEATLTHQYLEANRAGDSALEGCGAPDSNNTECFDAFDRKNVNPYQSVTFQRRNDTALRLEWDLEKYLLTSITGYRSQFNNAEVAGNAGNLVPSTVVNLDGGPVDLIQSTVTNYYAFTQEVRFASQDADFYNWTYGLYASRIRTNTEVNQPESLAFFGCVAPGFCLPASALGIPVPDLAVTDIQIFIPIGSEEYAFFTNQSFQWTDEWDSQIGVRYQSKRSVSEMSGGATFGPKKAVDEGVTGTLSTSYQLTDDVRLYATLGRSFRSGGFVIAPTAPGELTQYEPETSDSLELGFKSRLADGRVQINGAIYYQKYHDFLARSSEGIRTIEGDINGRTSDAFLNYNANAVSQGAELQIDALLTDDWQAGLGISYNDAKFTDGQAFCNVRDANGDVVNPVPDPALGYGVNYCDAKGRVAGEPNWGVSANSEYTMHFGAVDSYIRAQYTFSSGRSDDSQANSVLDTSSYGVWNLFLGVRDPKKVWEVSVWAKNLFDKEQIIRGGGTDGISYEFRDINLIPNGNTVPDGLSPDLNSNYRGVQLLPERQFGITGKYNFSL
jgi:iron complex outermembrane receptor protein